MKPNYIKTTVNDNLLFMENIEEKETRHEFEALAFNRDITNQNMKPIIDEIKN